MKRGAHSVYDLQYHLVLVTKYRHKVFYDDVEQSIRRLIFEVCAHDGYEVSEMEVMPDHIHMLICISPAIALAKAVNTIKSNTARLFFLEYPDLREKYFYGSGLWKIGYYIGSVGFADEDVVRQYIKNQKEE